MPNGIPSSVFCEFWNGTVRRKRWAVGGKIDNQKPGELDSPGWDISEVLTGAKIAPSSTAFSSEMDAGSCKDNASKQKSRIPFCFNQNR